MMKSLRWPIAGLFVVALASDVLAQERRPGRRIDLLKRIQLAGDGVAGTWVNAAEGAIRSDSAAPARLRLGKAPESEYDLVVSFTRKDGGGRMGVILSYEGSRFGWFLGEGRDRKAAGFALVNGRGEWESAGAAAANFAADKKKHTVRLKVRKEGVSAWLDRKTAGDVADYASLTLHDDQSVGDGMLGLVSGKPSIVFHSVLMMPYVAARQDTATPAATKERSARPARDDENSASAALTTGSIWSGSRANNNADTNGCTLYVNERAGDRVIVEILCGREHLLWTFVIKGKTLTATGYKDLSVQGLRTDAAASGRISGRSLHLRYSWTFSSKKRKNNYVMGELQFERTD